MQPNLGSMVIVTQPFASRERAEEARHRLARNSGPGGYAIESFAIVERGDGVELIIRTIEFHRDEIEHQLRSSGTTFNPPARAGNTGAGTVRPWLIFGAAAAAGAVLVSLLGSRSERKGVAYKRPQVRTGRWVGPGAGQLSGHEKNRSEGQQGAARPQSPGLRSHEAGSGI